jgi:hypothetical protein
VPRRSGGSSSRTPRSERARRRRDRRRRHYVGWHLRQVGRVRESLEEDGARLSLDALNAMSANMVALARMAAGRASDAVPCSRISWRACPT